jgi:phage tail-like protein
MDDDATFRYLNRAGRWLDFRLHGLEIGADGTLRLASLPLAGALPPDLATLKPAGGLAGVAVVPNGDVFTTDPVMHRLFAVDGCDGSGRVVACLTGPGTGPDELDTPRGLLYHRLRELLLVADSGNHRIKAYALPELQLVEIWGLDGTFDRPCSLAGDRAGNVYVADVGNRRVHKLDRLGRVLPGFWDELGAAGDRNPAEVAVAEAAGATVVFVLDADGHVDVLDADGHPGARWDSGVAAPVGLAASATSVYLGDNQNSRLLVFGHDGFAVGAAVGWAGPVAAVALDGRGGLLVHPGGARPPLRLDATGAYRTSGLLWGGPFPNPSVQREQSHLLRASGPPLEPGAHLQLFVCERTDDTAPPVDPAAADPFADDCWRRLPIAADAFETLFAGRPLDRIWVGVRFDGEGRTSPAVSQIRLDFAHEPWLRYLPALYGRGPEPSEPEPKEPEPTAFLARWLTLFESAFDGVHADIEGLAALFDPAAASPRFLRWLAGWLAAELPDAWDEARKRRAVAEAFASYARRGTVKGLEASLHAWSGMDAVIEEPIVQTGWWALPDEAPSDAEAGLSVLGATTVLAGGEPQGAVVGTTAVVDGSWLSPQEEYATALFTDVAHQFTVRVYRGRHYSEPAVAAARALLEREAPAHTTYHLCVVEPLLRVGFQARVGIDTVVAGPGGQTALDAALTGGLVLGGEPASRLGDGSTVGAIHLTDAPVNH